MTMRTSYKLSEFDFERIVSAIQDSYWGTGRKADGIIAAFRNSYPVGLFLDGEGQIGWARATSGEIYHAYIFDLIVIPEFRGQGLGKRLIQDIMAHPKLREVSGWMLSTRHHHHLYWQFGFMDAEPGRHMTMQRPL